jgi:hypothetical protein
MKLIQLNLLLFLTLGINAQTVVFVEPTNIQVGILEHNRIYGNVGAYVGFRYGDIEYPYLYAEAYKFCFGGSYKVNELSTLLLGITKYHYDNIRDDNPGINLDRLHNTSFDFGFICKLNKIYLFALSDPINWESNFGMGFKF